VWTWKVIATGAPAIIRKKSLTGQYLSGNNQPQLPAGERQKALVIKAAAENN
jgi:excinuclease UvrABC ATPase subunit